MQIEFSVPGLKRTKRRRREPSHDVRPIAPVVRSIVLAFQIEQVVRDGRARNYAEVAKQLGMTRARVSQVLRLLSLPPAILDTLLLADRERYPRLTERQLRPLIADSSSIGQLEAWESRLAC